MADPKSGHSEIGASSMWPILLAASLLLMAAGVVFSPIVSILGVAGLLVCLGGWAWENRAQEDGAHHA